MKEYIKNIYINIKLNKNKFLIYKKILKNK